jgi:hypothetical protein
MPPPPKHTQHKYSPCLLLLLPGPLPAAAAADGASAAEAQACMPPNALDSAAVSATC